MSKTSSKHINFYRVILFMASFLYLIFAIYYSKIPGIQDPIPIRHRFFFSTIFFSSSILSFFSNWIRKELKNITHIIAIFTIVHMIYINYIKGFNYTLAISIIVVIVLTNLIFEGNKIALYSNILLGILIAISLFLVDISNIIRLTYFLAYTTSSGLTYYINYQKLKKEIEIQNVNQEQDILLNTIDTKIWYLKDKKTFGKINQSFAEFLGLDKSEVKNRCLEDVLPEEIANICKKENEIVFKEKKQLECKKWMANSKNENRFLSIIKNPKLNEEGDIEYVVCSAQDITDIKKKEETLRDNKDLLSSILEVQNNLVVVLNLKGEIIKFNKACEKLTGYTFEEVRNKKIWEILIKKDEIEETKEVFSNLKAKNFPNEHENYWKTKTGELRLISWSNNVILDQNNEVKYIVATGDDITEKLWREKILKKSQQIANIGNWVLDLNKNTLFWSDEIYRIFGLNPQEFEATYQAFLDTIHPEDRKKVDNAYRTSIENNEEAYEIEHRIIKHDNGQIRYVKEKCEHIKNDEDEIIRSLGIVQDITESKEKEKEIKYLLYKDKLTGLYNRRFFEEEMKRLDTKRNLPISIIMGDVNGLKIINDSYGHKKGDELLVKTANILKSSLRKDDILARHGGDEFVILLPKTSKKEAQKVLNRIKEESRITKEDALPVSIGIGVAIKRKEKQDIQNVLKKADDEMYRNKLSESRSDKNKIVQNLLNTLEAKSSETKEHAVRMTKLAQDLGKKIGLSISELNRLSILATLHDIGKTTISEDILTKPGKLTEKEWEIIKEHSARGFKIASASEEFMVVADDILHHHEHWDGSGYPDSLKGEEIPYLARIISIIDAYDVMTNERPYSEAISKKEAIAEIKRCSGDQFDPKLVEEFVSIVE